MEKSSAYSPPCDIQHPANGGYQLLLAEKIEITSSRNTPASRKQTRASDMAVPGGRSLVRETECSIIPGRVSIRPEFGPLGTSRSDAPSDHRIESKGVSAPRTPDALPELRGSRRHQHGQFSDKGSPLPKTRDEVPTIHTACTRVPRNRQASAGKLVLGGASPTRGHRGSR